MFRFTHLSFSALAGLLGLAATYGQNLTVQIGAPAPAPTVLIEHTNIWRWHKGTNAPIVGWQTINEASLDATWGSGPGGFGYADNATETNITCKTVLSDMSGTSATNYSTFYIRKTFTIGGGVDTNAHILLTMDWDDGFIAWFDGAYVTNRLVTGAPTEPLYTALASTSHESSHGSAGAAPETYDLGAVGTRTGTHVLAIIGLNQNKSTSSDFILVADLALSAAGGGGGVVNNGLYALTTNSSVSLTGSNTVPGSTRVTINGDDVSFNPGNGTWTNTATLKPGWNSLFIAALDAGGNLLSNITQNIIYQTSRIDVSGTLASTLVASNRGTVLYVSSTVFVPTNMTLDVANGAVVLVSPGQGIYTRAGGRIYAHGTFDDRVFFNINGASNSLWGPLSGTGTNASIELQFADISHAQVNATTNAYGLIQDTAIHEFDPGAGAGTLGRPIMHCNYASLFEARRVHVYSYWECLVRNGIIQIEQCMFEHLEGDALDFDSAQPGSFTRNCTYRHGNRGNADAVDIGPGELPGSTDTRIENSIMWDFPFDKGVSVGDDNSSHGIIVSNCLIYGCNAGVMSKTLCETSVRNCTIVENTSGLTNYNKANPASPTGGGITTNSYDNIVWNNITTIGLANDSRLYADHNIFGNTNWPGIGNFDADPLFVDPVHHNYRLQAGSPAIGAGRAGENLGVTYPLGGIPMPPLALAAVVTGTNAPALYWIDDSQNEDGVVVQRSSDALNWQTIATLAADATNHIDLAATAGLKYYYRVQHTNYVSASPFSNLAATPSTVLIVSGGNVGGTISQDTCWADNGTFTVTSSITVAAGVTLYIKPGATVQFNAGLNLTVANGGRLMAEGSSNAPIRFTRNGAVTWGHLVVNGAVGSPETHIAYARFEFNNTSPCILVSGGSVFLDHLTFGNTAQSYLHVDDASFIVQNCEFPTATAGFEIVHGTGGIKSGGHGLFIRNFFGAATNYNDVVDFTGGNRPGPIVQFLDNVFVGSGDDELDLDGTDAWVEGNIFLHAHKNGSPDTSSGVSGGDDSGDTSEITVVGNLFYDVDHAAMAKGGNFFTMINNTVVHQTKTGGTDTNTSVFCLADAGFAQAAGMFIEGNIVHDAEQLTKYYTNSAVTMSNNLMPFAWAGAGGNNSTNNPLLTYVPTLAETVFTNWASAQIMKQWFKPLSNSPAIGTGLNGWDRGGVIPIGASISGEPASPTSSSNATLVVGFNRSGSGIPTASWALGSGYTNYKYRVDGGAWSAPRAVSLPILLTNLASGAHSVDVSGQRDTGFYQDDVRYGPASAITSSKTWIVGSGDTDGDGMPDDWEDAHGLDKLVNDAGLDPDGDGLTNLQEYLAGTDPHLANSGLSINSPSLVGSNILFNFVATATKGYSVLYRPSLSTGVWQRLQDVPAVPTNRIINVTNAPGSPTRFYQVVTPIMP